MKQRLQKIVLPILALGLTLPSLGQETRLKDLVNIRGNRSNQLIGFGLVVGLAASGDSPASMAKNKALANMLTRLGLKSKSEEALAASSAAVIVTGEIPAFARNGDRIDVKVSAVGDAKSLAGGTLILTPLKAADGQIYAVAQGGLLVGQANGAGPSVLTVANVPSGAVVEKEFSPSVAPRGKIILSLREPDYTTSMRVADGINAFFKGFFAESLDPVSIAVMVPPLYQGRVTEFISEMESIRVQSDQQATIVLNERTGTIIMGGSVTVADVSIAHGNLTIRVGSPKDQNKKGEDKRQSVVNVKGTTISELVESLNAMGVKPADLVGILQALHASGALKANIRMM